MVALRRLQATVGSDMFINMGNFIIEIFVLYYLQDIKGRRELTFNFYLAFRVGSRFVLSRFTITVSLSSVILG